MESKGHKIPRMKPQGGLPEVQVLPASHSYLAGLYVDRRVFIRASLWSLRSGMHNTGPCSAGRPRFPGRAGEGTRRRVTFLRKRPTTASRSVAARNCSVSKTLTKP
jgi:hypothetical protein